MRLGQKAMEALREEITGTLKEGDDIVAAGAVALQGTELLVKNEWKSLRKFFSEGFLYDAKQSPERYGIGQEIFDKSGKLCLCENGEESGRDGQPNREQGEFHAFYAMGTGGVLCALWKMAEASGTGLEVNLRRIPICQETIEICERFDLDPYRLLSGGSVLVGTDSGSRIVKFFRQRGIPAAAIGKAVKGNDRILYSGENARFLNRPGQDEITKLPWGGSWKTEGIFPGQERKEKE